jgi:hypothetical protein
MGRRVATAALLVWLAGPSARCASARQRNGSTAPAAQSANAGEPVLIDGIAVRIESDIITDSQVQELAAYQKLVDGKSQPRADIINELIDQWIVRGEASAAQYPQPPKSDVDNALAQLRNQFGSDDKFQQRCAAAGISEEAVRRILQRQIYLSRFLDFRFRPAAQVDSAQVRKYYDDTLVPKLKAKGDKIPPLAAVEPEIREVLAQQDIDNLSQQWLEDTRSGLTIDVLPQGAGQ